VAYATAGADGTVTAGDSGAPSSPSRRWWHGSTRRDYSS